MKIFLLALFAFWTSMSCAAQLEEGQIYRLDFTIHDLKASDGAGSYVAARPSKFKVVDTSNSGYYLIRFIAIYDFQSGNETVTSTATIDGLYQLPKTYKGVSIEKAVTYAYSGPVSGPLVTPFKYRLDDKSLAGDGALGYYAGYSWSVPFGNGIRIPFTPFISGGISQVSVADGTENDSKSAFTWSAGILIQNWGELNIGILYGQDRTGDTSWTHEGKGWFSFMVGWKLD